MNEDSTKIKLLPCPFCGKEPTIKQAGKTNYWWVGCEIHLGLESHGCGVSHSDYDKVEAIRKWNCRAGDSDLETGNRSVQFRRVVIDLEIHGSEAQANSVRDAVGLAADDEWLGRIVTPIVHSEEIKEVNWEVRGERFVFDLKPITKSN